MPDTTSWCFQFSTGLLARVHRDATESRQWPLETSSHLCGIPIEGTSKDAQRYARGLSEAYQFCRAFRVKLYNTKHRDLARPRSPYGIAHGDFFECEH